MRKATFVSAAACAALQGLPLCWAKMTCAPAFKQGFEPYRGWQTYGKDKVQQDFPTTRGPYKMIQGGDYGYAATSADSQTLQAVFPKGAITGKESGFTWYSMLPKQRDQYTMSYDVKFMQGFDWTKGGKLPGLCGGEGGSGSACPVGCSAVGKDRGFSTRIMWREGGAMTTYAYYPDKPKSIRCGEDWVWSKKLQSGKWYNIRMWIKLNTFSWTGPKANGKFKVWVDGKQVLSKKGIRFRYKKKFKVSRAYLTTYTGGSSRSLFAPKQDQYIWFDNFQAWEGGCKKPSW